MVAHQTLWTPDDKPHFFRIPHHYSCELPGHCSGNDADQHLASDSGGAAVSCNAGCKGKGTMEHLYTQLSVKTYTFLMSAVFSYLFIGDAHLFAD